MSATLPPFAPFPEAPWRDHIVPVEWEACLSTWIALVDAHLSLPHDDFVSLSSKDESLASFIVSLMREVASSGLSVLGQSPSASMLLRQCFLLIARLLRISSSPVLLLQCEFLCDFSRVYPKKNTSALLNAVHQNKFVVDSCTALKKSLILILDSGRQQDLEILKSRLKTSNHLIHASANLGVRFASGSDFLDGLISCYKITNSSLRKTVVTAAYLCLISTTEADPPCFTMLTDQLYALKTAAGAHRAALLSENDSMVAELVTSTPILKQLRHRLTEADAMTTRMEAVLTALEAFRKRDANAGPKRLVRRKIDKGKGIVVKDDDETAGEMRMHRMSQISQIQDLFPDLGSAFISSLLDEYEDITEQVVAHLLEDSLPPHLASADRTKELSPERTRGKSHDIAPRPTPPQAPVRHNVFDDDEFDKLTVDMSNLHFGKRNPGKTADDVLRDRSSAPNKAAILSALSAFDADDDERDDTYDAVDAGIIVNDGNPEDADDRKRKDIDEEALFRTYQINSKSFDKDAATRRSNARTKLKQQTGMTDEAIEGWAVMLTRTPQQMKQLETKYSAFAGDQPTLPSTAWRASQAESGAEESEADGGGPVARGGFRSRGRGRGRGGGRGGGGRGGNVAGSPGDKDTENARRRKEANKGSRANHNRRDQRAKKMARGGFPG